MKSLMFSSKRNLIAGIIGAIGLVFALLGFGLFSQHQQFQSTHQSSLAYLDAALSELTTFTPQRLSSDEHGFRRFREINSAVVLRFQRIKYGNDDLAVSALEAGDSEEINRLLTEGNALIEGFGTLIQARKTFNQYRQHKNRLTSEAEALVRSIEGNISAAEQQSLSAAQSKTIAQLSQKIQRHHYTVTLATHALESNGHALITETKALQSGLQGLIQRLTEGGQRQQRLSNPILRRMYVNLSQQLDQHYSTVFTMKKYLKQYDTLKTIHSQFRRSIKPFMTSIDVVKQQLSQQVTYSPLIIAVGVLTACFGFFFAGFWTKTDKRNTATNQQASHKQSASLEMEYNVNTASPENTQQRKQIITEKNQLIHDIQPIVDGVLYVNANEHAQTTGEIAKAFNEARRSLMKRVQLIQQEIGRLQQQQTSPPQGNSATESQKKTPSAKTHCSPQHVFDIKSCVDLTFETQAKVEHLQRALSGAVPGTASEEKVISEKRQKQMDALMECQDHLRVRLRDLQQLIDNGLPMEPTDSANQETPAPTVMDLERLSRLANSFQLAEIARSKARRPSTKRTATVETT